jgi:tripeptidyl-peptidase-1
MLDKFPSHKDLTTFMTEYHTDVLAATYSVVLANGGGYDQDDPSAQANTDIQYSTAMAYPTPLIFYSTGGVDWSNALEPRPSANSFLDLLQFLLIQSFIPDTISISYGFASEQTIESGYAVAVCNLFAQLGTLGVTVLVASGDDGVGHGNCADSSGNVRFMPEFPASCPWVTSVGGTTGARPEIAASISGGGFSSYFKRPKYQDRAVSKFLQYFGTEYPGHYDPLGRGYPDLAAQALDFAVVLDNSVLFQSSTGCAVSTVAGIISLINDFRISKGNSPLGFLNTWLYGDGPGLTGLNDIVIGSNPGCNTEGFPAIGGWDPVRSVTGLGTLNLLGILMASPDD